MKKASIIIFSLCATLCLHAQSNGNAKDNQRTMSDMLSEIEHNNTTLKALRQQAEADKRMAGADLGLGDPEVEFNRLWGNPSTIGNRTDFSVSQPLDIATLSGSKKGVATRKRQGIELQYAADRNSILLEAQLLIIDIIYYNAMAKETASRFAHADTIMWAEKTKFESGESNRIEYNNACVNYANATAEMTRIQSQRDIALAGIKRLNGGIGMSISQTEYEPIELPKDFNSWYESIENKTITTAIWTNSVALAKKEVTLAKTDNLPSLSVGYMSEKTMGERYQGVALGMSIPLWNNRNRVKQAKAAMEATKEYQKDAQCQLRSQLESLYLQCKGFNATADKYRQALLNANSTHMLKTALDLGEISLVEYMMQISLYYDTIDNYLSSERDYQRAFAELNSFF